MAKGLNKNIITLVRWEFAQRIKANRQYRGDNGEPDPSWQLFSDTFIKGYRVRAYYDTTLSEEEIKWKEESIAKAVWNSIMKKKLEEYLSQNSSGEPLRSGE